MNEIKEESEKLNKKKSISSFFSYIFQKYFSFEAGVDISNDTQVLYRRNKVIKNIIFVTNWLYTIILFIVSFTDHTNLVLSAILVPVTFYVNYRLGKVIRMNEDNLLKQQIAMYIQCFYMFLSAIVVYVKMKYSTNNIDETVMYAEVGYAMLYVSLVVVSLYQDKKLLLEISKLLLLLVTLIHFTVTYNFIKIAENKTTFETIKLVVQSEAFKDIILRTAVLGLFMIILYINVSISHFLQEERRKELVKRRDVESAFTDVVINMYNANFGDMFITKENREESGLLADMSYQLASFLGLKISECDDIKHFSHIYLDTDVNIDRIASIPNSDERFEVLRKETELGSIVAERLSLKRKVENIVRTHCQGSVTPEFIDFSKMVKEPWRNQIIALCDIYISLRSIRDYKRPYDEAQTERILETDFKQYFDNIIFDRFMTLIETFKNMYESYGG